MSGNSLKHQATSGMIWTMIQRYSNMLVQFICSIILARLLSPEDFGCIGMLTVFITISNAIINTGFASALIQKRRPTQEDYSTIFYWNVVTSFLMYVILFVSAPAIARFYNIQMLEKVLRVQGLCLVLGALSAIQDNRLRKQFQFKILAITAIISSLLSTIIAIILAYRGFGVWSLVAQSLSAMVVTNIILWITTKWRPLLLFSIKSFRELFGFGIYMFLSNIVNELGNSIQTLLIGRMYNASTLGYYSKASHTESLASISISEVLMQVTYPLYSEVQNEKERMINVIKRLTMTIAYITFPLLLLLVLLAKPLFVLLYSDKWLPSVPYFQMLCLAGVATCLQSVNYQPIAAIGKSKLLFKWTVIKRIVGTSVKIGGLVFWGIEGLLIGVLINNYFIYFANAYLVSKHIGYSVTSQMKNLLPTILLVISACACTYIVSFFLDYNIYVNGLITFTVFCLIYIGLSHVLKIESYQYFLTILPLITNKFRISSK